MKDGYQEMKSNAPWSVKGIERDARETAKEAAKRKGLTVGEWLNQMIYTAGDPQSSGGEVEGLKLRDIITAIEHLHKQVAQTHAAGVENVSEVTRKIGDMVERVQRLERVKPAGGGDNGDLSTRLDKLELDSNDRERINALKALEKAVTQVAVQFNTAQKMTIERLDATEQQLQEFAERVDGERSDGGGETADIGFVKDAIDGLSARLTRTEKLASNATSQKQDTSGEVDPAFVESTGNRLRVLGDEIKRSGDQIRTFENTIGKLSSQIDAAERRSAEGLQKVMETLAELREDSGNEPPSGVSRKDIDDAVVAAVRQTDARFENLQSSFESLSERLQTSDDALTASSAVPVPAEPASHTAASQDEEQSDDAKEEDATGKSTFSSLAAALGFGDKGESEDDKGEGEAASDDALSTDTKAANKEDYQESDEDPFSFADEIDAALDEVSVGDDAKDDFSFELDDEPSSLVENDTDAEAQALLSEVHDVFGMNSQGGNSPSTSDNTPIEADDRDDLDQILSDLDEMTGDTQTDLASHTPSLDAPETGIDPDTPDTDDDLEAEARARQQAMSLLFGEQNSEPDAPDAISTPQEKQEDYLQAARRQARDAATRAEEEIKPRRRKLTPKQKAILVARVRKKRLAEAETPVDVIKAAAAKEALQEAAAQPRNEYSAEDDRPSGAAGAFAALRSKLPFIGGKNKTEKTTPEPEAPEIEEARLRNGDRAAFESLKATASARPLTLALIVGIFLSLAVLFFMVKDIVFKSPNVADRGGFVAATPVGDTPPAAADNTLDVPNLPTIDPRALYSDAMAGLGAAETDAESAAAIAKLRESAALGYPPAQLQLGEFYKTGQGVDVDLGRARTWFRRAANGGNVLAMHRIGIMTARGEGGPADAGEAIGWFELAANRGLLDSQYNLGAIFHPTGDQTPSGVQDAGKAYYWYSLAARNGDEQAKPLAASVAVALSATEKAEFDKSIAEWQVRTPDAEANEIAPAG